MRPRGESISIPSVLYVGQWFRDSPQWTQVRSSSHVGWSCPPVDAICGSCTCAEVAVAVLCSDNESAPVQNVFGINGFLERAHHGDIVRRRAPDVKVKLGFPGAVRYLGG